MHCLRLTESPYIATCHYYRWHNSPAHPLWYHSMLRTTLFIGVSFLSLFLFVVQLVQHAYSRIWRHMTDTATRRRPPPNTP